MSVFFVFEFNGCAVQMVRFVARICATVRKAAVLSVFIIKKATLTN
jgi:hypothetical protein